MDQPHWFIVAIIGAFIGFAFNYVPNLFFYIVKFSRRDNMEGIWHEYHWSYVNGDPKIKKEKWIIKKRI